MRGICKVILRIISVCIFIKALSYVQGIFLYFISKSKVESSLVTINDAYFMISFLALVLFAILLWALSERISSHMVKSDDIQIDISTDILLRTAIIAIGLIMLANALPLLVGNLYEYISVMNALKTNDAMNGYNGFINVKADMLTNLVRLVFALLLVFGYSLIIKISNALSIKVDHIEKENINEDK